MKGDNFEMIGILWPFYGMCSHMLKIVGNSSEIEMVVIFNDSCERWKPTVQLHFEAFLLKTYITCLKTTNTF